MKSTKEPSDFEAYAKVVSLGAAAGLRTMMAPALLSYSASQRNDGNSENTLASRKAVVGFGLLAVGELIADKLPNTPNRTEPIGLAARIVSGAISGGIISSKYKKSVPIGIALGALAAIAAAYAGQNIRRAVSKETGIHSSVIGAVEDIIAIRIGAAALKD